MNELEELRKKKMELYKQQYATAMQSQLNEEMELQAQVSQLESNLKQMMTPDAIQRYSNLKLAHPQKAMQALLLIAQMFQTGNVRTIDDTQLKSVLMHITPEKKTTRLKLHGAI